PADRVSEHLPDFPVYVPFHKLPSLNPNPNSYLTFPPAPMELDPTNGVAFFRMKLDPVTDNHVFLIHDPAAPPMPSGHPDLPAQVWADYVGAFHFNAGLKLANSAGGPAFIATDQ